MTFLSTPLGFHWLVDLLRGALSPGGRRGPGARGHWGGAFFLDRGVLGRGPFSGLKLSFLCGVWGGPGVLDHGAVYSRFGVGVFEDMIRWASAPRKWTL